MKQTRPYPLAHLTPKGERALVAGHPWVYDTEVAALEGQPEPGGLVDVCGAKGAFLGTGFFSPRSKIRIRVFSATGALPLKARATVIALTFASSAT